jgi:hypothetical protein
MKQRLPSGLGNMLLALASVALFLLGVEVFHRIKAPYRAFGGAYELTQFRLGKESDRAAFLLDPELGFRPVLGAGEYSRFGTVANDYSVTRRPATRRLLFMGDSVTHRGHIMNALKRQYATERYEWWNAGVESFNTVQEVAYFRRFNRPLRPDEVVLTFHLNDFETTPVVFREADGSLVVYAPNWPARRVNQWLFRHSYSYRYWLGLVAPQKARRAEIVGEVREGLQDLRRMLEADGARLTVLVLPILRPQGEWKPEYVEYRRLALELLGSLGIRHFDLLEPLNQAMSDGVLVAESDDPLFWHPSREVSEYFARYLRAHALLEELDPGEPSPPK